MNEILSLGIATVDAIGKAIDQSPGPGELVFFDKLTLTTGGCAVNCSIDLARMGISNSLVVKLGSDILGDFVVRETQSYGIDNSRIIRSSDTNTSFSFAAVDSSGERRFYHTPGTNGTIADSDIDIDFIAQHKYCYVGGVMLMETLDGNPLAEVLRMIRSRGVVTVVDTVFVTQPADKWREVIFPLLAHSDYFVPSELEARAVAGLDAPEDISQFLQDNGGHNIIVKLGKKGIYYQKEAGENGYVPAYRVDKVEGTTGAGDAWDAGFLAGMSMGRSVYDSSLLGNAVAAFCIQASGASTGIPDLKTITDFQNNYNH